MRQEQERLRSSEEDVDINPPSRWNYIDTSSFYRPTNELGEEKSLQEIRFNLLQESNNHGREGEDSGGTNDKKPHGFEPFVDKESQEPQQDYIFVNNYGGDWSQKMELNRRAVERVLGIAHLNGKVFLSTLAPSRSRAEAQGNELAAKRFLIFEKKTQKPEEENPYKRVVSVPEGWRIEINDRRLTEELMEKRLGGERLQKAFIGKFNGLVREGIRECVLREKLTSEKDESFKVKFILDLFYLCFPSSVLRYGISDFSIAFSIGGPFITWGVVNGLSHKSEARSPFHRHLDHPWDYFIPLVQVDKVGRTYTYLLPVIGKGRTLVREVWEKQ